MTYEQSMINIGILKSFIRLYDDGFISFDFKNDSDFTTVLYFSIDEDTIFEKNRFAGVPLANIRIKNGYELLYYDDEITSLEYNLTTDQTVVIAFSDGKRSRGRFEILLSLDKLIAKLKKM